MHTVFISVALAINGFSQPASAVAYRPTVGDSIRVEFDGMYFGKDILFVSDIAQLRFVHSPDRTVEYRIDSGRRMSYRKPIRITGEGPHIINYRIAGEETADNGKSISVTVDGTHPTVTVRLVYKSLMLGQYHSGRTWDQKGKAPLECPVGTEIHIDAVDQGSGLKSLQFRENNAPFQVFEAPLRLHARGTQRYTIMAQDFVGNTFVGTLVLHLIE